MGLSAPPERPARRRGVPNEVITQVQPVDEHADVLGQLHRIREEATENSISSDLQRARLLVLMASERDRAQARHLYGALCQLERWLHDR